MNPPQSAKICSSSNRHLRPSESNQMESAVKMHHFIEEKDTSIALYKEAFGLYN